MLWRAKWVISVDPAIGTLSDGGVLVERDSIVDVGPFEQLAAGYSGPIREFPKGIIMPGLFNAHTHAAMVAFRGFADDLPLDRWLTQYIWPGEKAAVSPEFITHAAKIGLHEMLRSGTTCFADMYFFQEQMAQEVVSAGIRAVLVEGVIDFPTPSAPTPEHGKRNAEAFIRKWQGHKQVFPGIGLHAPYTCSKGLLKWGARAAREYQIPLHIHLAETRKEIETIREQSGTTPVRLLAQLGVLMPGFVGAHGVWVDHEEMAMLKQAGAGVASCPQSNAKLASGTAPLPDYMSHGVKLGLGTDGPGSNNDLDMFDEMRFAALIHKAVASDPTVMPADKVIEMATLGGARLYGLDRDMGSITPGKNADFIVVDTSASHARPVWSPESHIVYSAKASDVQLVVIAGRVVVEEGQVLTISQTEINAAEAVIREKLQEVRSCT